MGQELHQLSGKDRAGTAVIAGSRGGQSRVFLSRKCNGKCWIRRCPSAKVRSVGLLIGGAAKQHHRLGVGSVAYLLIRYVYVCLSTIRVQAETSMAAHGQFGRQLGAWLGTASDALVSVFYPAGCRLCEQLLTRASRVPICDECLASFAALPAEVCEICGSPVAALFSAPVFHRDAPPESVSPQGEHENLPGCIECQGRTYAFERTRSYAAYQGRLIRAILLLKFERIEPLAGWFATRLAGVAKGNGLAADVVVSVPLHRQRERERGYNQADLIARPLARCLGLPYRPVLLVRIKPRPNKHILSLSERWESVRGAFATRQGSQVDNLRVLLVDDVMTTGATLDACARALLRAGARSVIGLTVARAVRHPTQKVPPTYL